MDSESRYLIPNCGSLHFSEILPLGTENKVGTVQLDSLRFGIWGLKLQATFAKEKKKQCGSIGIKVAGITGAFSSRCC
jgi:hypothetical protein